MKILFLQLPHPATQERNIPLAAAYIASAIKISDHGERVRMEIFDSLLQSTAGDRRLLAEIARLAPDVIGFSAFLWNIDRSLALSREAKAALPGVRIVMGGPEIVAGAPALHENPHVDFWVFGEGEEPMAAIIGHLLDGASLEDVKGIAWRRGGELVVQKGRNIFRGFSDLPSPYLEGWLREADYRQNIILTMRGCRHGCKYCAWTSRGNLRTASLETLRREIEMFHKGNTRVVQIFDSAFNESPIFFEVCDLIGSINSDGKLLTTCFVSAGSLTEDQVKALRRCNVESVEVGLQAVDENVCRTICRFEKNEDFLRGVDLLKKHGIPFAVDYILGLPGETYASYRRTVDFLRDHGLYGESFTLSVSHGCELRREAHRHGMVIQERPPYYVLETAAFPRAEIEKAYLETFIFNMDTSLVPLWLPYPGFRDSPGGAISNLKGESERSLPLGFATLDFSRPFFDRPFAESIGAYLSERVAQTLTAHIILCDGADHGAAAAAIIASVLEKNPFINIKVVFEIIDPIAGATVALPGAASLAAMDAVEEILSRHRHFLDDRNVFCALTGSNHYVRSKRIYRILPRLFAPSEPLPPGHGIEVRALVQVHPSISDAKALPPECFKPWIDLLMTLPNGFSLEDKAAFFQSLFRRKHPDQEAFFPDPASQLAWEREALRLELPRGPLGAACFSPSGSRTQTIDFFK